MNRLDVHAHFIPDGYRAALHAAGHERADGMPALPAWDPAGHVEVMDRLGIRTALLSISSPGVHLGSDDDARALAREVNHVGHRAVEQFPGRFGQFAALPLPDVDGSLAEIAHAYDTLGVDGVVVLTNANGTYLGDPALEPVFDELDRRNARVFIHPTSPVCFEHTSFGRPRPMVEFLLDTTRAVVNLVLSGTIARHPGIEVMVPHAGAALAMLADRVAAFTALLAEDERGTDVLGDLAGLHYDLAGFPVSRQLDALLTITTLEHLHYGSDYPFTPEAVVELLAGQLDRVADPPLRDALTANTGRLFPRLAG